MGGAAKNNPNSRLVQLKVVQDRECGSCSACCEVLEIRELKKPVWAACPNIVEDVPAGACGIWEAEGYPGSCRTFFCLWRRGVGREEERPDRIGVVLQPTAHKVLGELGISAHEVWPGAAKNPTVQLFLSRIAEGRVVYLIVPMDDGSSGMILACEDSEKLEKFRAAILANR